MGESEIPGDRIASCCCDYGGVPQRWLIIESEKRCDNDLKQLEKRLTKQLKISTSELKLLMRQDFACVADAQKTADKLSRSWKYHSLKSVEIKTHAHYNQAGRPSQNPTPQHFTYRVTSQVLPVEQVIEIADFAFFWKPLPKILFNLLAYLRNVRSNPFSVMLCKFIIYFLSRTEVNVI